MAGSFINGVAIGDISAVIYVPIGNIASIIGVPIETSQFPIWTPVNISTEIWWDTADTDSYTVSGGLVTAMTDKSDQAHATTIKGTLSAETRTVNGRPVFDYDTNDDGAGVRTANDTVPSTISVFGVAIVDNATNGQNCIYSMNHGGGQDFSLQIGSGGVNTITPVLNWDSINDDLAGSTMVSAQPIMYESVLDFENTTASLLINGTLEDSGAYTAPIETVNQDVNMGMNKGSEFTPDGAWGELVIIPDVTEVQREIMEGYLAHKWGFEDNLPPAHPYKGSAPRYEPWTPASITTSLWFDASGDTTENFGEVLTNEDPINTWLDKSGNGHDISQVSTFRPEYKDADAAFNNLPHARFVAGNHTRLATPASEVQFNSAELTIASVCGVRSESNAQGRLFSVFDNNELQSYDNDGSFGIQRNDSTRLYTVNNVAADRIDIAYIVPMIVTSQFDGVQNEMYRNGSWSDSPQARTATLNPNLGKFVLGTGSNQNQPSPFDDGDSFLDGYVSEFIIYETGDEETRQKVEGYLAWKWGLVNNLPNDHPYRYTRPIV